jgi:PAT family beta-lactamase induction signal transducer AmpG
MPRVATDRSPSLLRVFGQPKMAALFFLGFSSGLPLFLTSRTLQAWMAVEKVDLTTIGLVSLLGTPYTFKFLWAPVLDRYIPPFLGRRRGWLVITQLALLLAIAAMSLQTRGRDCSCWRSTRSSSPSSAPRRTSPSTRTRWTCSTSASWARGRRWACWATAWALILTGGIALVLADRMPWPTVYLLMATLMLVGVVAAVRAPEPVRRDAPPLTFASAVVGPIREFFGRTGIGWGALVLLFAICYQLADRFAANLADALLDRHRLHADGDRGGAGGDRLGATIVGVLAAGLIIPKIGINRAVWIFAFVQIGSNLAYYWVARVGADRSAMVVAIVVENFAGGLVTAVFVAFMLSLCNKRFSATQYALLSSLMAFARDFIVAPSAPSRSRRGGPPTSC